MTSQEVVRCADAGKIPQRMRYGFEQWLRATLEFSWLADRHFRTNQTLKAKKAELKQLSTVARRLQLALEKPHIRQHLLGASLQRRLLGKQAITEARHCRIAQASQKRIHTVVRHGRWLSDLIRHDLKHLDRRPESGDERKARHSASKPAIDDLTHRIIDYWQGPLRRAPKASAMARFTAVVFRVAGERSVTASTAAERLRAAIRARVRR